MLSEDFWTYSSESSGQVLTHSFLYLPVNISPQVDAHDPSILMNLGPDDWSHCQVPFVLSITLSGSQLKHPASVESEQVKQDLWQGRQISMSKASLVSSFTWKKPLPHESLHSPSWILYPDVHLNQPLELQSSQLEVTELHEARESPAANRAELLTGWVMKTPPP